MCLFLAPRLDIYFYLLLVWVTWLRVIFSLLCWLYIIFSGFYFLRLVSWQDHLFLFCIFTFVLSWFDSSYFLSCSSMNYFLLALSRIYFPALKLMRFFYLSYRNDFKRDAQISSFIQTFQWSCWFPVSSWFYGINLFPYNLWLLEFCFAQTSVHLFLLMMELLEPAVNIVGKTWF